MTQTFAGYLYGMFQNVPEAQAIRPYVKTRVDRYGDVRERILADAAKGAITVEREGRLLMWFDELHTRWLANGKLIDARDPRDWKELGEGARMRVTHKTATGGRDDI